VSAGRLAGKVALVTGAGSAPGPLGVGAAIAERFAGEGARVAVLDRDPVRAHHTAGRITAAGGQALVIEADLTDAAACRAAADATRGAFGGLDILVNNAALLGPPGLESDEDDAAWEAVLGVNLTGTMRMTRAALPLLTRAGGAIVNIVSTAALRGFYGPAYSASKGGMIAFTRTIAHRYGRRGVRANCVAPGTIHAPMSAGADAATRARLDRGTLLGTPGDAHDIANGALFLASDEARWITGVVLPIDGGAIATTASGIQALNDA
jgi:NAD(P)-dependent dehydrogenase (short-subunit alcohol dehydrogenase family)